MFYSMLSFRANIFIVIIGALLIIGGIKIMSLLPAKYYFSFSKMVAGAEGPFLVDPPSVSGRKLCDMLQKYGISESHAVTWQVDCRKINDDEILPALNSQQTDLVYTMVLQADPKVKASIRGRARSYEVPALDEGEFTYVLQVGKTIGGMYEEAASRYQTLISSDLSKNITEYFDKELERVLGASTSEEAERVQLEPVSAEDLARIQQAITAFRSDFKTSLASFNFESYTKSQIDAVLRKAGNRRVNGYEIANFYVDQVASITRPAMAAAFAAQGLPVIAKSDVRKTLFAEMSKEGLEDYLIAIALRLAPVVVFAVIAGLYLGRPEVNSISLAGGFAALLLAWPVIYVWDQLVAAPWQPYRLLFMAFYVVYILAFFFLGARPLYASGAARQVPGRPA